MVTYIVVGRSRSVVVAVLQSIRSFIDARCVVIGDDRLGSLRWSPLCQAQVFIDFDGSDDDDFVMAVESLSRRHFRVIVIPVDCDAIRLTNRVRNRLAVRVTPIPDTTTLEMFDNQWRFQQFCTRHGLSVPQTRFIGLQRPNFDAIASELGVPFVLKPVNPTGSSSHTVVADRARLERFIRDNHARHDAPLIAQRYIDGEDIALGILSFHGRLSAFAIQQHSGPTIAFLSNTYLKEAAQTLCLSSAFHGVMQISARIEPSTGEVFLLESKPRFWASLTASAWCGLNFVAASIMPPDDASGLQQLTAGASSTRNPVMRPSAWRWLLTDPGQRGRLLRAEAVNLYAMRGLVRELCAMLRRFTRGRVLPSVDIQRKFDAAPARREEFVETVE